jgi:hypothetical protein
MWQRKRVFVRFLAEFGIALYRAHAARLGQEQMNSLRDEMRFESDTKETPPQTPVTVSLGAEVEARRGEIERKYAEPCRYWSYIHPGVLTNLQKGREGLSTIFSSKPVSALPFFKSWRSSTITDLLVGYI